MFERFARDARAAVVARARRRAAHAAPSTSSPSTCCSRSPAGTRRGVAGDRRTPGLDARAIEDAIEQDLVAALEAVGVPAHVVASTPIHPRADKPGFSVGAKQALEQAMRAGRRRGDRRMGSEHVLLGLLDPPAVGVARVLRVLDVPPHRLADLVQVEMAARR